MDGLFPTYWRNRRAPRWGWRRSAHVPGYCGTVCRHGVAASPRRCSVIGFAAGFAWKTRDLTESMGRSAAKQMGVVRDQHWLDRHPIDYA
jgi:hypothetical protein